MVLSSMEHAAAASIIWVLLRSSALWLTGWLFLPVYTLTAFFSHFILDIIPHRHCFTLGRNSFQKNQKEFWLETGPGILFTAVVFPLLIKEQGFVYFFYCFWGMLCANLPDILALRFKTFKKLNDRCHWFGLKRPVKNGWRHYAFRYTAVLIWLRYFLF